MLEKIYIDYLLLPAVPPACIPVIATKSSLCLIFQKHSTLSYNRDDSVDILTKDCQHCLKKLSLTFSFCLQVTYIPVKATPPSCFFFGKSIHSKARRYRTKQSTFNVVLHSDEDWRWISNHFYVISLSWKENIHFNLSVVVKKITVPWIILIISKVQIWLWHR